MYLYKRGAIDGDNVIAGFSLGHNEVFNWCKSGVPELRDIGYVNTSSVAGVKDKFISINSCLMVGFTGVVYSESIGHTRFSCTGGQLDYVLAASISKGGQSCLYLKATLIKKEGTKQSNIMLNLPKGIDSMVHNQTWKRAEWQRHWYYELRKRLYTVTMMRA